MANTTQKALDLAQYIKEELSIRLGALGTPVAVADVTFDSDGNPLIQIGTGANGAKGGIVKVLPTAWPLAKDVLGNAAIQYGPHTIQIGLEANYAGTTDNVADINTWDLLLPLIAAVVLKGCRVELYQSTNGTAPTSATLVAANLKATYENLYWPLLSSQ